MVMGGATRGVLGVFFSLSRAHMWKPTADQGGADGYGLKHGASWVGLHTRLLAWLPRAIAGLEGRVGICHSLAGEATWIVWGFCTQRPPQSPVLWSSEPSDAAGWWRQ